MPTPTIALDERIHAALLATHETLAQRGELLPVERLQACYATFRNRFGPDRLSALDGVALLHAMHAHGGKESLVYWLEFKNDEEFPTRKFGGIGGGGAHKFRMFRRQGTEQWVFGSPQRERDISEAEAVTVARTHRDQLLAGLDLLAKLPAAASDADYLGLQKALEQQAPNISGIAWAHKYWSLLFPEKLDDYHVERFQRHNLLRLLQTPPAEEGLYVCAGRYVQLTAQLGWSLNTLTSVLNERNGPPVRYWRVGTEVENKEDIWPAMRGGGYAAIGWAELGDLTSLIASEEQTVRVALQEKLQPTYPGDARTASRKAGEITNFAAHAEEGDVVLAAAGERILGVGRIAGPYRYESTAPLAAPHRRAVDWISTVGWKQPEREGLLTTFCRLKKFPENLLAAERALLAAEKSAVPRPIVGPIDRSRRLEGIPGRLQAILERKGQAILYGPPGTGKTHWARQAARDLAALGAFGRPVAELNPDEHATVEGSTATAGLVRFCTFHPGYGYEDFIEGFRPQQNATGQLIFQRTSGVFKTLCADASRAPERKFFLLIDEINRGDIPRIFGELLTLLESDKRGLEVTLALSGERFSVPLNVQVIGTMNTADRSIALLDTALRRRFGFVELMPDASVLGTASAGGIPLGPWLTALNDRLRAHLGRDARNLQIGHAYLLENGRPITDLARFVRVLAEDIVPLLEEYCYEDYAALTKILGPELVDEGRQRIREELFSPARRDELVPALLALSPEIATSPAASTPVEEPEEPEEPET